MVYPVLDIGQIPDEMLATEPFLQALPQNLWVKGSNISRMEAFGFFAFPR